MFQELFSVILQRLLSCVRHTASAAAGSSFFFCGSAKRSEGLLAKVGALALPAESEYCEEINKREREREGF